MRRHARGCRSWSTPRSPAPAHHRTGRLLRAGGTAPSGRRTGARRAAHRVAEPRPGTADLAAALGVGAEDARDLVDRAYATGLLDPSLRAALPCRRCIARWRQLLGAARHHEIETALLRSQLDMSTLTTDLALQLAEHGLREPALAAVLEAAAERARGSAGRRADLPRCRRLPAPTRWSRRWPTRSRWPATARAPWPLADTLLGTDDPARRAAAVRIAAAWPPTTATAAHAAELFDWLGPHPDRRRGRGAWC